MPHGGGGGEGNRRCHSLCTARFSQTQPIVIGVYKDKLVICFGQIWRTKVEAFPDPQGGRIACEEGGSWMRTADEAGVRCQERQWPDNEPPCEARCCFAARSVWPGDQLLRPTWQSEVEALLQRQRPHNQVAQRIEDDLAARARVHPQLPRPVQQIFSIYSRCHNFISLS